MKGWRKPKAFAAAYSAQKRFLAFVLTLALIFTSVGTDLNVSYAAQGNKVDFEIYGSDLVNAINEAVESDNVVKPDSLEFTNGAIDKFETLFYGEGKVYEVYPQIDGGDMDAELRVFVRLPEDADDMYMVTGDEEVIFLYVNNGDETISCATRIIRSVDGEEKVKTTKRINVKSYEDKFGDEEVDIVSKKDETVEETTASEEKSQDTVNDTASEETTTAEEKETEITDETAEATEKETTEAAEENTEAETEEATEAEKETEAETEKETAEETEKETAEEKVDAEGEITASLSRHYAPVVAMKEDAQAEPEKETAEAAETEKEVVETEKETTEAVEKETADAVETEKETTEAETKDVEVTETETEAAAETEETAEDASKEETAAGSKENEETEAAKETVAETSKAAETTAEAKEEENKKAEAATDSDLVGIGYCSTAKAYTTTVKALKALDDIQGLKVTYAINPEYSARIVDGPRGVEEGDALVFGVKNQIGYAIESVTANGEFLEADSTSDNEDGSVTAWYTVPEVTEEQEIEVYMTETDEHPEFNAELTMEDGTIITLHAAEGVLPAGVTAEATVKDDLADALKEKVETENAEGGAVKTVVYDINLMFNGHKLDNTWAQNGSVKVTFSGSKIEEMSTGSDSIEICALDDASLENPVAENLSVEHISTEAVADTAKDSVSFEAEHFTAYAAYSWEQPETWKSASFIPTIENAQVAYSYFYEGDTSGNADIIPVESGTTRIQIDKYVSSKKAGYVVFFVKPDEDYLLTGLGAAGNGDLYALTRTNFGNINGYPGLKKLAARAKEAGYLACFGYTQAKRSGGIRNAEFVVKAVKPTLSVKAASNKVTDVAPGETLTFTITVNPVSWVNGKEIDITDIRLKKVTIEGNEIPSNNLTLQPDRTYTTTVLYTVTEKDCEGGYVNLSVTAETDYEYLLSLSDTVGNRSDVVTKTTITANGDARCNIAPTGVVTYSANYIGAEGIDSSKYPAAITTAVSDDNTYYQGRPVTVKALPGSEYVEDAVNAGYWTRTNTWRYGNNKTAEPGKQIALPEGDLHFIVDWSFHAYVTINYRVASGKGNVNLASEKVNPRVGTAQGSAAIPATGYGFEGWYSDPGCTTKVGNNAKYVPTDKTEATYYAKFTAKQDVSYTVHYYEDGTANKVADDKIVNNQTFDATVEENAKDITGYTLVGNNNQTVTLDAYNKEIKFYYTENQLVEIQYQVADGQNTMGSVTRSYEDVKPVTGTPAGSTANVNDGYSFVNWTVNGVEVSKEQVLTPAVVAAHAKNGENIFVPTTFVANFQRKLVLKAKNAQKAYDGKALTGADAGYEIIGGQLKAGDRLEVTYSGSQTDVGKTVNSIVNAVVYHGEEDVTSQYAFAPFQNGELTVNARPIKITAASDSKEYDGTPLTANRYSVSENGLADSDEISAITIDGSQIEIGTSSNAVRAGSVKITKKAEAANSRSAAEDVTDNYDIKLEEGILEVTNRNDLSYIVNYHYLDAKGKEVDVKSVTKDNAFIGEEIAYSDAVSRDHAGKTYALVRVDSAGKTVEYYADGAENPNVVDVYYGLDEIGTNTEKPKTPDGIPDMYQVVFRYISENPSYGTVDGVAVVDGYIMEVVTRPQKADGSYDMDAEVYPLGNVTVTGIGNYTFNHWSDSDTNYANANEIAGHGFKSDMTFVAHFSYDGGNNNNNNNGGGNGGSGGGSSSGSHGAIKVTSGGPGEQTVTIDGGDVPLAGLPDLPASPVEIDDGEIPLAALPKTGQTTMKLTLTLMFSGIFLALAAMSKKHKEEES